MFYTNILACESRKPDNNELSSKLTLLLLHSLVNY